MTYTIQLQMTPTMDDLIPMSRLYDLAADDDKSIDSWLQSRGIPLEYFYLYAEPIVINNTTFARRLIVRVGKIDSPVMIDNVLKNIQKSLSKEWQIVSHGQVYSFSVKIEKFKYYVNNGIMLRVNDVDEIENQVGLIEQIETENMYEDVIQRLTGSIFGSPVIKLTKMNFCERVHLERTEWIGLYQEIRLNLTDSEDERVLGDSEYNIYPDDQGKAAVDICVDDFNPLYYIKPPNNASTRKRVCKVFVYVYILYHIAFYFTQNLHFNPFLHEQSC